MKFTVFTPFYEYIDCADAIFESLLKQTYVNWEWLILDDFSENSEVIEKLKQLESLDDRVRLIYPEYKNQYLFNLPIKYSSGDIMVLIDSDDIPYPKILEVYKNILEKFPNLSLIGCSSLIKGYSFTGETTGAKYINYKGSPNYIKALNNGVMSIMGDARAFKISKIPKDGIFSNEIYKNFIGVDAQKVLKMEEVGDIVAIPRILHNYTMRGDSMSGGVNANKYREDNELIVSRLFEEANDRVDRENLISINNYFDESFRSSKNFYFSDIDENDGSNKIIEYWDNKISYREKIKLNELYFDHKINYNVKLKNPNVIIISIEDETDLDLLNVIDNRNLLNCPVTVTSNLENYEKVMSLIESKGVGYWFNIFHYLTVKFHI
jgi:glycosyltransferase involved in cell wall biosynthesis